MSCTDLNRSRQETSGRRGRVKLSYMKCWCHSLLVVKHKRGIVCLLRLLYVLVSHVSLDIFVGVSLIH
jgi:hypothetical protein